MIEKALPLVGVTIILVLLLYINHVLRKGRDYRYKKIDSLLTKAELDFYHQLIQFLPQYAVMCKVRLADILEPAEHGRRWYYAFNKIRSKHLDFLIVDPTNSRIISGIELDDSTHQRQDRILRDKFLDYVSKRCAFPLHRYKAGIRLKESEINNLLSIEPQNSPRF